MTVRLSLLALLLPAVALAKPVLNGSVAVDGDREPPAARKSEEGLIEVNGAGGPHEGHHEPQFGGTLVPLGRSHAHLEILVNPEDGQVRMWVLDAEAKELIGIGGNMILIRFEAGGEEIPVPMFPRFDEVSVEKGAALWASGHRKLIGHESLRGTIEGVAIGKRAYRKVEFTYPEGTEPAP